MDRVAACGSIGARIKLEGEEDILPHPANPSRTLNP
jgi:hypothetical protein